MSQLDLADASKTSQGTVSKCETGKHRISAELKKRFADALNVQENMIEGPVTLIPKSWERLVSDPRLAIIMDYVLSCSDVQISQEVHKISLKVAHGYAP